MINTELVFQCLALLSSFLARDKTLEHFTSSPPAANRLGYAKLLWAQCAYQIGVELNTSHTLKESISSLFKWLKPS